MAATFPWVRIPNLTTGRGVILDSAGNLTNDVAATGTGAPVGALGATINAHVNGQINAIGAPFSAPTDGTDASAALLSAFSAGVVSNQTVYLPPGTYKVNSLNYLVTNGTSLRIVGAGSEKTILAGDNGENDALFLVDGALSLSGVKVINTEILASLNAGFQTGLSGLSVKLDDVVVDNSARSYVNGSVIFYGTTGPFNGTLPILDINNCMFTVNADSDHMGLRCGFTGLIRNSKFLGGKRGIFGIPTADPGSVGGNANVWYPDVVIENCIFDAFTYAGTSDSYHIQSAGERWTIIGCKFGTVAGTGATSSGNIYSNLRDSSITDCQFTGGGFSMFFAKGSSRDNPSVVVTAGDGYGNRIVGCTFTGHGNASSAQVAHAYLNVKEQTFLGCTFRGWKDQAIDANSQGDANGLQVIACKFYDGESRTAMQFAVSGTNILIAQNIFKKGMGTNVNAQIGMITFDGAAEGQVWEHVTVTGNEFYNPPFYAFQMRDTNSVIRYFRWTDNKVTGGNGRGMSGFGPDSGVIQLDKFTFTGNSFTITNFGWNTMPLISPDSVSDRNTWIQATGTPVSGFPLGSAGRWFDAGNTTVVDFLAKDRTNSVAGALSLVHATNGVHAVPLEHRRWLLNGSGSDQTLTVPALWRTNVFAPIPPALTNGTQTLLVLGANGPTDTAARQTNVVVLDVKYFK